MGRSFWLANGVILLDEVLYLALIPLLPTYAERFDFSKAETGFLYAAYPLLVVVTSVPAGLIADRVGGRGLLLVGCALLVVATVGFAFATSAWEVWAMRALQGLTAGMVATAGMATIAAGATSAKRATTIGIAVSLQGLSALGGYVVGGFLSPAIGIRNAFLIPAGVGVVILIATALDRSAPVGQRPSVPLRSIVAGAMSSPAVRAAVACILAVGLVGSAVQTLASLDLHAAGYTISNLGTVFVIAAAVGFAATPIAGRAADRRGVVAAILVWSIATPLLVLALVLPHEPAWAVAGLLVVILPMVRVGGSLAYARGAQYARLGEGLAVGYGIAITAWSIGAVIGPLTAGAIADATGNRVAFLTIAVLAGLLAVPAARRDPLPSPG